VHIPGAATLFVKFDPRYATGQIAVTFNVMFYRIINPKHTFLRDFVGYADAFTDNVDEDSFFCFVLFCFYFSIYSMHTKSYRQPHSKIFLLFFSLIVRSTSRNS